MFVLGLLALSSTTSMQFAAQVKDGRWAYTVVPSVEENDPGHVLPDVYSRIRAPWNVNDRP